MSNARVHSIVSFALLVGSLAWFASAAYFSVSPPAPLLFAVAIPLAWSLIHAELARRHSLGLKHNEDLHLEGPIPRWLFVLGLAVVLAVLPAFVPLKKSEDQQQRHESVKEQSWHERDGKYFTRINGGAEREISKAEFESQTAGVMKFLALGCIIFSFISLILWQQEAMRLNGEAHES